MILFQLELVDKIKSSILADYLEENHRIDLACALRSGLQCIATYDGISNGDPWPTGWGSGTSWSASPDYAYGVGSGDGSGNSYGPERLFISFDEEEPDVDLPTMSFSLDPIL